MTAPSHELPVHLTRFIGRERELTELARLAQSARLLTLTGAGGSGKTRLARELALRVSTSFDRVGWVDLAPIGQADAPAQQVATALNIHDRPGTTPLDLLIESLRDESALVVLDNCEHVVDACAPLVEALLRACPRLTIVATSREALGASSETAWLVPSLVTTEAVQLFHERAQLALPTFVLNDVNLTAANEICRRLDGIPLAIELAAARVRVLTPPQIASRLDDALHVLGGGSRTAMPRHRTLRATMEWSFGLLNTREQVLLRRLSVFAGTFTLDAAESVCVGDPLGVEDILDGVTALVDKSLIVMGAGEGIARYRLLETVRQYGTERLEEAGESDAFALRFAERYIETVESIGPKIVGGESEPGLIERLRDEHDNVRAAATWASSDAKHAELALRFVGALGWFWYCIGQFREGRQLTDRALALDSSSIDSLIVGRARLASALVALFQGDLRPAIADFEAAIPLLRGGDDPMSMGTALSKYGATRLLAGEIDASIAILDEAVEFIRWTPRNDITRIFAVFWRGWAAYAAGDIDMARELVSTVLGIGREYGFPTTIAHALSTLGLFELIGDNVDAACVLVREGLEIEVASRDGWGIAIALDVIARIAARRGRLAETAQLIGAVDAHRKRIAVGLPGIAPRERDALVATLRATPNFDFAARYAEGFGWSTEQTIANALAEVSPDANQRHADTTIAKPRARESNQPGLRVFALGRLNVLVGDRPIDTAAWGSARPRELLMYLLMHPEGRSKEQVGLVLWPEASTSQLRSSFHVALHRLRKALGGNDWVTLTGDRYRVDHASGLEFDVASFEDEVASATRADERGETDAAARLERALDRYRGDLLDGEPMGDWYLDHRDRLRRIYMDGLMRLGALHVADERHAKAADVYRRVLARDELHEKAIVALIRCHGAAGEREQALRVYRKYVDRLREELGAEPSGEVVAITEQL